MFIISDVHKHKIYYLDKNIFFSLKKSRNSELLPFKFNIMYQRVQIFPFPCILSNTGIKRLVHKKCASTGDFNFMAKKINKA